MFFLRKTLNKKVTGNSQHQNLLQGFELEKIDDSWPNTFSFFCFGVRNHLHVSVSAAGEVLIEYGNF